jgi:hypothetical protein
VALFGPTDPAVWAPVGSRVRVVAGRPGGGPWADADQVEAALRALLAFSGAEAATETTPAAVGQAWP